MTSLHPGLIGIGGTLVPQHADSCAHEWVANRGRGGKPDFHPAAIVAGDTPVTHAECSRCRCRTWFTEARKAASPGEEPRPLQAHFPTPAAAIRSLGFDVVEEAMRDEETGDA